MRKQFRVTKIFIPRLRRCANQIQNLSFPILLLFLPDNVKIAGADNHSLSVDAHFYLAFAAGFQFFFRVIAETVKLPQFGGDSGKGEGEIGGRAGFVNSSAGAVG